MNASLVELVQDDGGKIGKQRVLLEARRQNAFGDDEQPRVAVDEDAHAAPPVVE